MATLGPLLAKIIAQNIGGQASRSELDKLSEPLKKLVVRYPKAKAWLESGLNDPSFPSDKVSATDKSIFVKKVIRYATINICSANITNEKSSLRGSGVTNQVVRDFWLSCRGSNFSYAS